MFSKSLEKTEEQKSCLVRLQILVEKYKKHYCSHWKVVKTPDQGQKLSNNQLSKAEFRGSFPAKNYLILPYLITSFDCILYFSDHASVFRSVDDIKKDPAHQMRIRAELDRQHQIRREQRKNRLWDSNKHTVYPNSALRNFKK